MRRGGVWLRNVVGVSLFSILALSTMAAAGQFETFTPLLVNLNGWQAEAPEGMDMDMGTMKMVQAMREYTKGNQSLNAMVMVGNSMMAQGQTQPANIDSDEGQLKTQKIDGFQVTQQHAKKEVEGVVVVSLGGADQKGAQFILHYTGLKPDEALALAKEFDWQKLREATLNVK